MDPHFDIAVPGTGPGGYIAALEGGQLMGPNATEIMAAAATLLRCRVHDQENGNHQ